LISHGYSAGDEVGIFHLGEAKPELRFALKLLFQKSVKALLQTAPRFWWCELNSADFGHSAEMYQQAAFAKLRAIETGRALIGVSTVGVSAVYAPNGSELAKLPTFKPGIMVATVPLKNFTHTCVFP
jgi:apolipoprotein N-acyltransferase